MSEYTTVKESLKQMGISNSRRKYYLKNREKLLEKSKKYNESHRESGRIADKKYKSANKDKINQYSRDYYKTNKTTIKAKQKEMIKCCECGRTVQKYAIAVHNRSKVHLLAVADSNIAQPSL